MTCFHMNRTIKKVTHCHAEPSGTVGKLHVFKLHGGPFEGGAGHFNDTLLGFL